MANSGKRVWDFATLFLSTELCTGTSEAYTAASKKHAAGTPETYLRASGISETSTYYYNETNAIQGANFFLSPMEGSAWSLGRGYGNKLIYGLER